MSGPDHQAVLFITKVTYKASISQVPGKSDKVKLEVISIFPDKLKSMIYENISRRKNISKC